MTDHAPTSTAPDLLAVRTRRASLSRAGANVNDLLHAHGSGTPGGRPGELIIELPTRTSALSPNQLIEAVTELVEVWHTHSADTEAPGGILTQILDDSPRLASMIDRLRREHEIIGTALGGILRRLEAGADCHAVEATLVTVLADINRHRRDGRELIYSAYNVDLGLGE
jgi:hypothetical protein